MTIWTKQSPPTTLPEAGLDAAGWSGPVPAPGLLTRLRRLVRRNAFTVTVLLPTLLAAVYLYGIAAPQYESEARFLVRGRSSGGGGGGGGGLGEMMASAGFRPASEDAMGVRDYLQSHDVVAALRGRLPVVEIFRRPEADPLARLWWSNPTAERLLDYFRRMAGAEYDTTSGITTLRVRSFRAEDSKLIAENLLGLSEELVNRLNKRLQEDGLRVAREEVQRAEARLTQAQLAISEFRERERAVDPTRSAGIAVDNIGRLEGALAQARAELAEAQRFARTDNPRLLPLRNRVEALTAQIAEERRRLGGDDRVSQQVGEYERLSVERELAHAQLASATASLEKARGDAQRQQIFLLRVVEPNLAEYARYPKSALTIVYIFACLSVGYGLAWLLIAGMREHAS
ncbi:capsule biosynthesis protein [Paracraurococcus lichenis]|uniref:Capsule biosynthesis protein n=1 Tax=Paracraurococcus lichenis TaxID=3064888 RepID=A0ABT9DUA9_9PROT|nr:capsule biosynthesis protein [Paracraurococcus sp. LOR1-02]MDO9707385.1 capsule biosynthesis protein [Paracraurococcus sp. LOR1-02]